MVADVTGYEATTRELLVARVTTAALEAMERQETPLGLDRADWDLFQTELLNALAMAHLDDAETSLRGTAQSFFSQSPAKQFPSSAGEVVKQVESGLHTDDAVGAWREAGYETQDRKPGRHFWDSRFNLKMSVDKSDYDIQLASDMLQKRAEELARERGQQHRMTSPHGGGIRVRLVLEAVPELDAWAVTWLGRTNRKVNVAGFPSAGPADDESGTGWPIALEGEG
ncbi:MAG: hypothetical protein WD178_11930 [Actinomycetota bacterium]